MSTSNSSASSSLSSGMTLEHRRFSEADQIDFAALSGDRNPLHIDPLVSRRLLFGRWVVHGVHTLLWALDAYCAQAGESVALASLNVEFKAPVSPGDECSVSVAEKRGRIVLEVKSGGRRSMVAKFKTNAEARERVALIPGSPPVSEPVALERSELERAAGDTPLQLDEAALIRMLPALHKHARSDQVAVLLASTRIVGMQCPGLNSVFAGLRLDFTSDRHDGESFLHYETRIFEPRFSLLELDLVGPGVQGTATCYERPQPHAQPSFAEVRAQLRSDCFAGQVALVVGGSRGLGALTATMVAAGGGEVLISYCRGREDAETLAGEIAAAGGRARTLQLDVSDADSIARLETPADLSHVYYFATPRITRNETAFDEVLVDSFREIYVDGFEACVRHLLSGSPSLSIFYPSSIYVTEGERGFAEYARAKQEGEVLCARLEDAHPGLRIRASRLARLATDQTAGLVEEALPDALPILISEYEHLRN